MAKKRVSELAKEYGVTSKEVLALLTEMGEFVKAAETDIARVESGLAEARQGGAPAEDIAAREAQLRTMKQVLQRTLERNAGV